MSSKNATQSLSEPSKNGSAPASMVLLPEGILDLSDELSSEEEMGEGAIQRDKNVAKANDTAESNPIDDKNTPKAKLRIKTGGSQLL